MAENKSWHIRLSASLVESGQWAKLSPSAAKVLIALSLHADKDGRCYPSAARLGELTGISCRQNVYRAINELCKAGLISREQRGNGRKQTAKYRLLMVSPAPLLNNDNGISGDTINDKRMVSQAHQNGITSATRNSTSNNTNKSAPKKGNKKNSSDTWAQAKKHLTSSLLDTKDMASAWGNWAQYRREAKKKLTPSTIKSQIGKLEKMGSDGAIASIEQSIERGWSGLFAPKDNQQPGANSQSASWTPAKLYQAIQAGQIKSALLGGKRIDLTKVAAYGEAGLKNQSKKVILKTTEIERAKFS